MQHADHNTEVFHNLNSICHKGRKSYGWKFLWRAGDDEVSAFKVVTCDEQPFAVLSIRQNHIVVASLDANNVSVTHDWEKAYLRLEAQFKATTPFLLHHYSQ